MQTVSLTGAPGPQYINPPRHEGEPAWAGHVPGAVPAAEGPLDLSLEISSWQNVLLKFVSYNAKERERLFNLTLKSSHESPASLALEQATILSMHRSAWARSQARKSFSWELRDIPTVFPKISHPESGSALKRIGRVTKLSGRGPLGDWSQVSFRLKVLFTENEHILFDFLFLPGQCWHNLIPAENHLLSWFCCDMYDTCSFCSGLGCWNQENTEVIPWSGWGKVWGDVLPNSLTAEKKNLENISASLKILKLKGNNRTETHFKTSWFRVVPDFKMVREGLHSVEILCSWTAHTSQHPGDYFSIAGEEAPQCNL